MKAYEDIKHMLCDEIKKIAKQDSLSAGSLETLDKLTHSLKSIITVMAMEGEDYSKTGRGRSFYAGRMYGSRNRGAYREGGSSYGDSKDEMIEELEDMLEMAETKSERSAIEKCIKQLEEDDD